MIKFINSFSSTFASSAFVPTEGMPTALRVFAENQPITRVIEAVRALFLGLLPDNNIWISIVCCIAAIAAAMLIASRVYRNKSTT